jgi:hypothetical protein
MSAAADVGVEAIGRRPPALRWLEAWSRLHGRDAYGVALASVLMGAINVSMLVDKVGRPGFATVVLFDLGIGFVVFAITLLAWSAAVHEKPAIGAARVRAVAIAIFLSGLLSAAIVVPTMNALGIPRIWYELMGMERAAPPLWVGILANTFQLGLAAAIFVLVVEVLQRRSATAAAVHAARRERAAAVREVLESRLAAMQAQVEPQFLFNTLVAIEALYQKDAAAAAANLDRLIQYLRVALPRLREPGSTIGAEIDLVRAYLAVVTSLHGDRPSLTVTLGHGCGESRFYPMLLLPLIQRAVSGEAAGLPESIRIGVQKVGDAVVIVTRIAHAGDCTEDAELARVRERLAALYGDRADLACTELDHGTTQFTLRIPAG